MSKIPGNFTFVNICCFGINNMGVAVSAVIAYMCPSISVVVVDLNPEKVMLWNTKQIPIRESGLEDILKKCLNINLFFSPNTVDCIKAADIILVGNTIPAPSWGGQGEKNTYWSGIEKSVKLIAEFSENKKIIVMKNVIPFGSNGIIQRILTAHNSHKLKHQILSMPEFFSPGNAVKSLLNPDRVLIGSENTQESEETVQVLVSIYSQWVPRSKILTMKSWSAELSRLGQNLLIAQRMSDVIGLSILCEETGADVSDVLYMVGKCSGIGREFLKPSFGLGGSQLVNDVNCLIYMCDRLRLKETADYWRQILLVNEEQKKRFLKKILSSFFNTLMHKKIAVLGLVQEGNVDLHNNPAVELCLNLLEEKAALKVYEPRADIRHLVEELKASGNGREVSFCDDPYKATQKTDAVVLCSDCDEFRGLDFERVHREMLRPAFIFDGLNFLPHSELTKMGFVVHAIGKQLR